MFCVFDLTGVKDEDLLGLIRLRFQGATVSLMSDEEKKSFFFLLENIPRGGIFQIYPLPRPLAYNDHQTQKQYR